VNYWGRLIKAFLGIMDQPGTERPSPSSILKGLGWLFEPAVYLGTGGQWKLRRTWCYIPFIEDPIMVPLGVPNTNSEDPIFDEKHTLLYLQPANNDDLTIMVNWLAAQWFADPMTGANIIAYWTDIYRVHRLTDIIQTPSGRRWRFTGSNNTGISDPILAEDKDIKMVVAMICYGS